MVLSKSVKYKNGLIQFIKLLLRMAQSIVKWREMIKNSLKVKKIIATLSNKVIRLNKTVSNT